MSVDLDYDYLFKLIIIGDSGIGKSSLLMKYVDRTFQQYYNSTIGVDFKIKTIDIDTENSGKKTIKLQIWDTAGQERFRTITNAYYKNATGVIVVFDLTDRESFHNVSSWVENVSRFCDIPEVPIILVGNKSDLQRKVYSDEIKELVKKLEITHYIETSAKNGNSVDECFHTFAMEILEKKGRELREENKKSAIHLGKKITEEKGGYCGCT